MFRQRANIDEGDGRISVRIWMSVCLYVCMGDNEKGTKGRKRGFASFLSRARLNSAATLGPLHSLGLDSSKMGIKLLPGIYKIQPPAP